MRKLDSNAHSVFLLCHHLILVIKYRKKILTDPVSDRVREMEIDDKYYVSLLYAAEEAEHEIRPVKTAIGLDFSMSELYVDSNGAHADYPHFFRKSQEKLAREQRRLSHCEKGSSRYMKQKIARLHVHIARQRKDYLHKESRKITNCYDLVCIEALRFCSGLRRYETVPLIITEPWDTRG